MGLLGIVLGLALLMWLAYRGWSVLRVGPLAALVAAALYGGVSLFVVAFVVAPIADALFREADVPHRLMPAAIALGAFTFSMIAATVMLGFGLWWLGRVEAAARRAGEGYGTSSHETSETEAQLVREHSISSGPFDPEEMDHGRRYEGSVPLWLAGLPRLVVVVANLGMSVVVLPRLDTSFLAEQRWGSTCLSAMGGIWSVATALLTASTVLVLTNRGRLLALRETMDAGANAAVLPCWRPTSSLASLARRPGA